MFFSPILGFNIQFTNLSFNSLLRIITNNTRGLYIPAPGDCKA